jgi:hypothetical protein
MDLKYIWSESVCWIQLAHGNVQWWASVNMVMNFRVQGWKFLDKLDSYRRLKNVSVK